MKEYQHFGVMLDCSRNAVMNLPTLKRFIDCLEKMGYNTLELYMEDVYDVKDEPYFGYLRGRYSQEELKEIGAYAAVHGIELIPAIQTLAHYTNLVKLPHYAKERKLFDILDILMAGDDGVYEFLDRLFAALRKCFQTRHINIGMDEAHFVGLGRYLDEHGFEDRFRILLKHLARVAEIARKYGFEPHMWSDMFFRLGAKGEYEYTEGQLSEEVLNGVPENVALCYWNYYDERESHYDTMFSAHKLFGREIWFAGGAWSWNGFAPSPAVTYSTMKPAFRSLLKTDIRNVIITMWGDNGSECSRFSLLQTLYAIRRFGDGEFDEERIAAEFDKLFGVSFRDFELLALPDAVPDHPVTTLSQLMNPSKVLLYSDPFLGKFDLAAQSLPQIPYGKYARKLCSVKRRAGDFAYLFETMEKLCRVLEVKAYLGVQTRTAYRKNDRALLQSLLKDYTRAISRLHTFYRAFRLLWFRENKPFGFEIHDVRLGGLMQRLMHCRNRIEAYLSGKINRIEELEEELLPYDNPNVLECNDYRKIISACEI